jgi:hypothetical protein
VTPDLRGRIKIAAFRRGVTVADMLRDLLAREFPPPKENIHDRQRGPPRARRPAPIAPSDSLTHVELTWIEKRIENWIRFGQEVRDRCSTAAAVSSPIVPAASSPSSAGRPTTSARSFAHRHRARGRTGRTLSDSALRAPGGDILLKIEGWPKVEQVLRHIDAVEAIGIDRMTSPRSLAARRQPDERRPRAARLHQGTPSGVAQAAGDREMTRAAMSSRRVSPSWGRHWRRSFRFRSA